MLLALMLALVSSPSAVPEPPLWSAPAGCPSQAEVEALMAEELATNPEAAGTAVVTAVASATEQGRWRVEVVVRTIEAEVRRELELDSCEAAAEAVALVYGLALADVPASASPPSEPESIVPSTPNVRTPAVPPRSDPPPEAPREGGPLPPIREPSLAAPPASRRPSGVLHAGAGAGVGSLGRASGHVLLGTALVWPRIRWGIRLDHALVRRFRIDPGDLGGNLSALTAGTEVSVPVELGPIQLLPTAGVRAGSVRARGVGGGARTRWVPWVLGAAGLSLVWPVSNPWRLRVGAEVEVPMVRHTFKFDDRFVTNSQGIGGLLWLGPELGFR